MIRGCRVSFDAWLGASEPWLDDVCLEEEEEEEGGGESN
jgi:hypothetical protein